MRQIVYSMGVVFAAIVWQAPVLAQESCPLFDGCRWTFPSLCDQWRQRKCWCCDDYCPKTLPSIAPAAKGCVDDYCPKKLPCVPPNPKGCVDDYCRKTCPIVLPKQCDPWYTCGPAMAPCAQCPAKP
ncbi:MAG TPA: hypothetical protein VK395_25645 [Gemmataceae bacterium]|nr:hypothetical protein [Gemmataceae bacterium]